MKTLQNFYKQTITIAWATGTGNRYVSAKPTPSSGWLVISPNSSTLREIVAYSGTGTDGSGDYITITARGVGGTTEQTHAVGEAIRMNITAQHWADIYVDPVFTGTVTVPTPSVAGAAASKGYVDGIAIAGAPDSSASTKGIGKTSVAPASASNPIFVGDNDGRVPTQDENDALVGTSGTAVSSSNKLVDNGDTSTTGSGSKIPRGISGVLDSSWIPPLKQTFVAGENLTAGNALHVTPFYQSGNNITVDNQQLNTYNNTTNQSVSFTVGSGSSRFMIVGVLANSTPSAVTYNSVAMTLVDSQVLSAGFSVFMYRLIAPTTGVNNIVVTATGIYGIVANSWTGVDQTTPIDVSAKAATGSVAITSLSQGSIITLVEAQYHSSGTATFSDSYYTSKYINLGSGTGNGVNTNPCAIGISYTPRFNETISSTVTLAFSGGSGTVVDGVIAVALKPATTLSIAVLKANSGSITTNRPLTNFIGFADSTVSAGANVVVSVAGVTTGLSGLTAGEKYYLQNTAGTIGTSRGTYGKYIGTALSATSLLINSEKTTGSAITKAANYTYTAETDGFATLRGANTIITDGVTFTGVASSTMSIPVSRGKTYIMSTGASDTYFIPLD